jgi:regulator of chromosome condensation
LVWLSISIGEVSKPKRNTWIEERIEDGIFGEDNGGIESVACGGLHTIFLDERGTVSVNHSDHHIILICS